MSASPYYPNSKADWSIGLWDCSSDMRTCCMSCWCPCVIFSRITDIVDKGQTSNAKSGTVYTLLACVIGPCLYSAPYRSKLRKEYNLKGSGTRDCLIHSFCEQCALTQEYRELQNHGFDMELGWQGNLEKQKTGQVATAPMVENGMQR